MKPYTLFFAAFLTGCGQIKGAMIYFDIYSESETSAALAEKLEPYYQWFTPEPSEKLNTGVLLVPGCLGTQPFHLDWANFFKKEGATVLLIDSFAVRGIDSMSEFEGVCEGEQLWGFQRAGDVAVSLQALREHDSVDPSSLLIIGWSHGGWAVMDALSLAASNQQFPMLNTTGLNSDLLGGVQAAIALYPYCGFGSYSGRFGLPEDMKTYVAIASRDENIDPKPCRDALVELGQDNQAVALLEFDTGHWFDNPLGFDLIPHVFDEVATSEIKSIASSFILNGR